MLNKNYVLFFGLILLIAGFFYIYRNDVNNMLNTYNLLPRKENLTELYFENHETLPRFIESGEGNTFKFTVHNLENQDYTYNYDIIAESLKNKVTLKQGSFTLKNGRYQTLEHTFTFEDPIEKTKISVNLKNKKQSIHFWTEPVVQ